MLTKGPRRVGEYTLTQHDITGKGQEAKHHADSIAVGEFPIDSFPCRKRQPGDTRVLEGYLGMLDYITRPYEIPYRIMIPEKTDGLDARLTQWFNQHRDEKWDLWTGGGTQGRVMGDLAQYLKPSVPDSKAKRITQQPKPQD